MFICSVVFGVFGQEANEQEPTTSLRGVSRPSASATTKQSLRLPVNDVRHYPLIYILLFDLQAQRLLHFDKLSAGSPRNDGKG